VVRTSAIASIVFSPSHTWASSRPHAARDIDHDRWCRAKRLSYQSRPRFCFETTIKPFRCSGTGVSLRQLIYSPTGDGPQLVPLYSNSIRMMLSAWEEDDFTGATSAPPPNDCRRTCNLICRPGRFCQSNTGTRVAIEHPNFGGRRSSLPRHLIPLLGVNRQDTRRRLYSQGENWSSLFPGRNALGGSLKLSPTSPPSVCALPHKLKRPWKWSFVPHSTCLAPEFH